MHNESSLSIRLFIFYFPLFLSYIYIFCFLCIVFDATTHTISMTEWEFKNTWIRIWHSFGALNTEKCCVMFLIKIKAFAVHSVHRSLWYMLFHRFILSYARSLIVVNFTGSFYVVLRTQLQQNIFQQTLTYFLFVNEFKVRIRKWEDTHNKKKWQR